MYAWQHETPERHTRSEILEELNEIISKYNQTHAIIILGDMNASLKPRKGNEQDVMLQKCCDQQKPSTHQSGEPTFFHENERDVAELDYILCCEKAILMVEDVQVDNTIHSIGNTSDHKALTATLMIRVNDTNHGPILYRRLNQNGTLAKSLNMQITFNVTYILSMLQKVSLTW